MNKRLRKKAWKEPRLPKEKISELALGIFKGEIFTSNQIGKSDRSLLQMIFLPLAFFSGKQNKEIRQHPPAMLCGWMKDAMPRSINGYPIFSRVQMVYAKDVEQIFALCKKLRVAAEEVLETESAK